MNLRGFIKILFIIIVLLQATFGVAVFYQPELSDIIFFNRFLTQAILVVAGCATWVLAVGYVIAPAKKKKNTRYLNFNTEGGAVSISVDAISDFLSRLISEFPSLVQMKPEVKPAKNAMDIKIKVKVKAGSQVSEICDLLQKRVREAISSGLGIDQVNKVEVSVEEIVAEHVPG
ncbi:hypothetical protein BVX97_04905 [bacterium E08(2017)]|nr:hypothetical protein BVX97_04905 [bacterium E08(2017)]